MVRRRGRMQCWSMARRREAEHAAAVHGSAQQAAVAGAGAGRDGGRHAMDARFSCCASAGMTGNGTAAIPAAHRVCRRRHGPPRLGFVLKTDSIVLVHATCLILFGMCFPIAPLPHFYPK
ncbi:hypothetical protein BRADI_3g45242v3 [Brachypodium distachyon]|uniref:Uncharacterized protein n=1 Tax=Brachypodium distachyon TaxID=15368 RepID=A0A2K2D3D3_BRADI|nr:hypothetical protein BRADI_3g45242v3 [Brachypodium distachyon]